MTLSKSQIEAELVRINRELVENEDNYHDTEDRLRLDKAWYLKKLAEE